MTGAFGGCLRDRKSQDSAQEDDIQNCTFTELFLRHLNLQGGALLPYYTIDVGRNHAYILINPRQWSNNEGMQKNEDAPPPYFGYTNIDA